MAARKVAVPVIVTLVGLVLAFFVSYALSLQAIHRSTGALATVVQLCEATNVTRAAQISLWEHLVVISKPPPGETVQARTQRVKTTQAFLAYIRRVFAPRNCAALKG